MQGLYDIHSHILPGVDDGAVDMEQTKKMLTIAYQEGIRTIIATPHYEAGRDNLGVDKLRRIYENVKQEAYKLDDNFKIYLGNELLYSHDVIEDLVDGSALTIAETKYILIEFLPSSSYRVLREGIQQCVLNGYIPIIAHSERYDCLVKNINLVEELVRTGAYIQINLSSVIRGIFDQRARFTRKLLRRGWVHFVGTDTHNTTSRAPYAQKVIHYMRRKYGDERAKQICFDNPISMLMNQYIEDSY